MRLVDLLIKANAQVELQRQIDKSRVRGEK